MLVFFILLLTVCGFVLLTACANIANFLLARATARHKEMATRRAIGADSGRLVRQLLTESVLLSLTGGAVGYLIAEAGARYFGQLRLPVSLPVDFSVSLDSRVLAICTGISFLTGVVFGLAPALHAVRQNLVSGLKDEPARFGRSRWWHPRTLLMISQVAICTVLLVCSGLFLRTLDSARSADTGMAHRNLVLIGFDSANRLDVIARRARDVPGVESAAITTTVPLSLAGVSGRVTAEDKLDRKDGGVDSDIYDVSRSSLGPWASLSSRVVISGSNDAERDVAILNQTAAERLFPGGNAIGRYVKTGDRRMHLVIGVVVTVKSRMMVENCTALHLQADPGSRRPFHHRLDASDARSRKPRRIRATTECCHARSRARFTFVRHPHHGTAHSGRAAAPAGGRFPFRTRRIHRPSDGRHGLIWAGQLPGLTADEGDRNSNGAWRASQSDSHRGSIPRLKADRRRLGPGSGARSNAEQRDWEPSLWSYSHRRTYFSVGNGVPVWYCHGCMHRARTAGREYRANPEHPVRIRQNLAATRQSR